MTSTLLSKLWNHAKQMNTISGWLGRLGAYFRLIGASIKDNVMPPKMQMIKVTRSHIIPWVVIVFDVSEVGNIVFDITDASAGVLVRADVRRRIIGLISLKLIGFLERQSWVSRIPLSTHLTRQLCKLRAFEFDSRLLWNQHQDLWCLCLQLCSLLQQSHCLLIFLQTWLWHLLRCTSHTIPKWMIGRPKWTLPLKIFTVIHWNSTSVSNSRI